MSARLERTLNNVENTLSKAAAIPIVGTIPAAFKVVMGIVQTIFAISVNIPARIFGNKAVTERSWTHVKHGLGNIVGGSIEAIPVVGSIAYGLRKLGESGSGASDVMAKLDTGHGNKFMPYELLEAEDFTVTGCMDDSVQKLQAKVNEIKKTHTTAMDRFNAIRTYMGNNGWWEYREFKTIGK